MITKPQGVNVSPHAGCEEGQASLLTSVMVAQLLGFDQMPTIVSSDGRVSHGLPTNQTYSDFLNQ